MSKLRLNLTPDQVDVVEDALKTYLSGDNRPEGKHQVIAEELLRTCEGHERADELRSYRTKPVSDESVAGVLEAQYGADRVVKLGAGERLDVWAGITRRRGEEQVMFWSINPERGWVAGKYIMPLECGINLVKHLIQEGKYEQESDSDMYIGKES